MKLSYRQIFEMTLLIRGMDSADSLNVPLHFRQPISILPNSLTHGTQIEIHRNVQEESLI